MAVFSRQKKRSLTATEVAICALLALQLVSPLALGLADERNSKTSHRGPPLPAAAGPGEAQRRKQTTADLEQRKQKFEKAKRDMQATEERLRSRMSPAISKMAGLRENSDWRGSAEPALPPFNPASAPPAADCWRAYVAAAKSATSMDQLLNYLPYEEQKTLRERQARYDPKKAAESQQRWRKKDPEMKESAITFLTNSPYANALDHHKSIANKFLDVLSAKSDGNKATIVVSTLSLAKSGGQEYPYGKATIELVGEAGYWRIDTYNDSGWHYKEMPTTP